MQHNITMSDHICNWSDTVSDHCLKIIFFSACISVLHAIIAKAISPMSRHRRCLVYLLDNDLFPRFEFRQSWNACIGRFSVFFFSRKPLLLCSSSLDVAGHAKWERFWGGWTSGIYHSSHATWSVMTSRMVARIHLHVCMPLITYCARECCLIVCWISKWSVKQSVWYICTAHFARLYTLHGKCVHWQCLWS